MRPTTDSKRGTGFFENGAKALKLVEHPVPWQTSTSNIPIGAKEGVNCTSIPAELPGQTEMGGCQRHVPAALPWTDRGGVSVVLTAILDEKGEEKTSCPHQGWNPGQSIPQQVAIPGPFPSQNFTLN